MCNDHDYCYVETPNEDKQILKYNYGEKTLKAPAIIYAESLLEKMLSCQNNPENLIQRKKLSIPLLVTHCLQVAHLIQKKINCSKGEDCMEKLCKDLRGHAMKIINDEKKKRNDTAK